MLTSLNKVQKVNKYLRNSILRGKWSAGDKIPSERDLTVKLKASHQVIREAVSQLVSEGLVERKHGSGTYVAPGQKANTIAILARTSLLASPSAYVYRKIVDELKTLTQAAGYRSVMFFGDGPTDKDYVSSIHLLDQPVLKQVAGVISLIRLEELEERLWADDIPVVSINPQGRYRVWHDYTAMTEMAAGLLEQHGFREFGLMRLDYPDDDYNRDMNQALARISDRVRGVCKVPYVDIGYDESCNLAYDVFKEFWATSEHPRAMFFYDDALCDIALRAILELRINVPEDLAIVTQSNVGRRFHFPIPITSVEFDPIGVAQAAWAMLKKLSAREPVEEYAVYVPPHIQEGKSLVSLRG